MASKLLIVEVDDPFRQNLARWLAHHGLQVEETSVAEEAEEIVRSRQYDIVLIGLTGLGREGLHLLKAVKEISPRTEVILITGQEQLALSIEGMKLGALDEFGIPLDMKSLLARVDEVFKRRGEHREAGKE